MRPIEISLATKSSSLYFWIISSSEQTPSSSSFLTYVSAEIFLSALRMYFYYSALVRRSNNAIYFIRVFGTK